MEIDPAAAAAVAAAAAAAGNERRSRRGFFYNRNQLVSTHTDIFSEEPYSEDDYRVR